MNTVPTFRRVIAFALIAIAASVLYVDAPRVAVVHATPGSRATLENPDAACAACHQTIYDKYRQTGMARGSGVAMDGLIAGGFHHAPSGVDYRVFERDGAAWMSYSRPAKAAPDTARGALEGERRVEFYVGSGHRGRTYLFNESGRWYELPINYYTRRAAWDMAPAFDNVTAMPAPLPVDPNCLHCHATDVQASLQDARNHYAAAPFRQGGIGCSACHGDPTRHLADKGHGPIVNPGKLPVAERDSACIQCHLEGDAVVYRPGRSLAQFRPGDKLSDIAVYFVRASEPGDGRRATSQYEALLRSACKRASGDKLTCTTCHDPHSAPSAAERVSYFRARCLACHTESAMATHHSEQQDCATCHMPTRKTVDISHEQVTDHDIEARPASQGGLQLATLGANDMSKLVAVGGFEAGDRETGLAYAQLAGHGDRAAARTALGLLSKLPARAPAGVDVAVRLGYLEQISGDAGKAAASYKSALETDPWEPTALANLAVLDAGSGRVPEAINLLQRLVDADPSRTAAGLNLAFIECSLDRREKAAALLERLRRSNPDDPQLRRFADTGEYAGQRCLLNPQLPKK
nr:tetratricopeptide repeat protein [Granulicella aggregans]